MMWSDFSFEVLVIFRRLCLTTGLNRSLLADVESPAFTMRDEYTNHFTRQTSTLVTLVTVSNVEMV